MQREDLRIGGKPNSCFAYSEFTYTAANTTPADTKDVSLMRTDNTQATITQQLT